MGRSILKAVVLFTLLIVCVDSQLEFQGNALSDESEQETEAVEKRDNYQQHVIINSPDCRSKSSSSCNCTKIQKMMSAELQQTNRQLQQLQTGVSDQQGLISEGLEDTYYQLEHLQTVISDQRGLITSGLNDTNRQLEQLKMAVSNIADLLTKNPVAPTTQRAPIATTKKIPMPTTPVLIAEDCTELLARSDGAIESGVYTVQPPGDGAPLQVYCDMETDDSGWTVFQRRQDGSVDFYRNFKDYRQGFGNLEGEFWLGNDNLHQFTAQGAYRLRVDMTDFQDYSAYAVYDTFRVAGLEDNYKLEVADYSGTAGDSLSYSKDKQFSTWDQDRDVTSGNCAEKWHGAWWFANCFYAHLNGEYIVGGKTDVRGIIWEAWRGYSVSLKSSEMKIQKKF